MQARHCLLWGCVFPLLLLLLQLPQLLLPPSLPQPSNRLQLNGKVRRLVRGFPIQLHDLRYRGRHLWTGLHHPGWHALEMPPNPETDLWRGLVIPDDRRVASAPQVEMMRTLFNEDMTTEHIQAANLRLQTVLPATLTSVVISYCSHSLEWLPVYLRGMQINDLTIYSKCNRTSKLTQSAYINEIHKIAHETVQIKTLQNVGGCDHTYAHDMAHRDWAKFANHTNKHTVLYLKDGDTQLCTKNMIKPWWSVLRPSTMVQVAAMTGFGCNIRTEVAETLWHTTKDMRTFNMNVYVRASGKPGTRAVIPFQSPQFRNLGGFADEMGVALPEPLMPVCYGGTFAVSGARFTDEIGTVAVAQRLESALARGDNIVEGHHMERMWGAFLQNPPTPAQVGSLYAVQTRVCATIGQENCHGDWPWLQKKKMNGKLTAGGPFVVTSKAKGWRGGTCSFI